MKPAANHVWREACRNQVEPLYFDSLTCSVSLRPLWLRVRDDYTRRAARPASAPSIKQDACVSV
jgi:hypothetical protein